MNNKNNNFCSQCFKNSNIVKYIKENGTFISEHHRCNYCDNSEQCYTIQIEELIPKLANVITKMYEYDEKYNDETYSYSNVLDYREGYIKSLEEIFEDLFGFQNFSKLSSHIMKLDSFKHMDIFSYNFRSVCAYGVDLDIVNWKLFTEHTKYKARYFDHKSYNFSVKKSLERFNELFSSMSINMDENIYRARIINKEQEKIDIQKNPSLELGKAPSHIVKNNRFSPIGISYGYFSFNEKTALKESRAKTNEEVAIGIFKLTENLKLIDFRKKSMEQYLNPFLSSFNFRFYCIVEFIEIFITSISKPISDNDSFLEYVPTQIMAEYIWSIGYDGLLFDSSQECGGENIVIFGDNPYFESYKITS